LLFLFTIFINSKSYAYPLPVFIFLYFLLNYLKSWSIVDMRICFAFLGIFILQQLPEYKNQIKENE
jgi:hypothetical protein